MLIKLIAISILLISTLTATAQQLTLIDNVSKKEITDALVQIGTTNYTSDHFGKINHLYKDIQVVTVSHLNYQTYQEKHDLNAKIYIYLTPKTKRLDEVIITGQFEAQSAKNSVYNVRTINKATLEGAGAATLPDILNTQLNIRINRDNATGSSNLSLQGISGQNVKVLLDGVPISGRNGTQNEIDISQIDINTIERIEIVEGPMSVIYGADALAGVINIITKKETTLSGNINIGLHGETVAKDISIPDEGIHNFNISGSKSLNDHWHVQLGGTINKFGGWQGNDPNYDNRNRLWYPKQQYFGNGIIRYGEENIDLHYRLDYSNTLLTNLGTIQDNGLTENTAVDEEYRSKRWMHQVQSSLSLEKGTLNGVLSFSRFDRSTYQYNKYLESGREVIENNMIEEQDSSHLITFFARFTYSTSLSDQFKLLVGTDATIENGANTKLSEGNKSLTGVNLYSSLEWRIYQKLLVRPSLRYGYNSIYDTPVIPSLNIKYDLNTRASIRIGYGRGFRAPALTELYYEFVDSNHRIFGNKDLQPEYSHNINAQINHEAKVNQSDIKITSGVFYNHIDNRITFITPEANNPDNNTILTNILKYKTTGGTLGIGLNRKSTSIEINTGLTGRYQQLTESAQDVPQFVFSHELTSTVQQEFPTIKTTFSANYKYTGPIEQYALNIENTPTIHKTEGFHWLNMSASRKFGKSIHLMIGAKNLLNIQDINVVGTTTSGGAHGGGGTTRSIGYGRSYFLRINYQLNF